MVLQIENLHKSFSEGKETREILKGISWTWKPGRIYILKGRSGCGKSTLLSLVGLLDEPTSGRILLDGKELTGKTAKEKDDLRCRFFSFLTQEDNILPEWTVKENLRLVRDDDKAIDSVLEKVSLADKKDRKASSLSKGESMRLALARVILEDKAILLLDEPTGNLDKENTERIFHLLSQLAEEKIVFVVSHDFDEQSPLAEKVVVLHMKLGKIVEECQEEKITIADKEPESHVFSMKARNLLSLTGMTLRHSLLRSGMGFLLLTLFFFFAYLFVGLLSFDASPYLQQGLSPNDLNALTFLTEENYIGMLFLAACLFLSFLTLFFLTIGYRKENQDRQMLFRLIGFPLRTSFAYALLPLFAITVASLLFSGILYVSLHGLLESLVARLFASSSYPFLPGSYTLLFLILGLLVLPLLFAIADTFSLGNHLVEKIKRNKE